MRIGSARPEEELEISLIPLIDVVLTLIIFFVVTTTFQDRNALKISLPEASGQQTETPKDPLVIVVDAEGRYFVGGNEVLRRDAAALREAIGKVAGDDKDRTVILRADGNTPHQAVVTAMDSIGRLGFSRLTIATVPAEPDTK